MQYLNFRLSTALYFFVFFSIDERAVRTVRELDASVKRKKQGGGGESEKLSRFARFPPLPPPPACLRSLRLLFCVAKSRGCG